MNINLNKKYIKRNIIGRNSVLEALKNKTIIDKLFILDGCHDGIVETIKREAKKQNVVINYVPKEYLFKLSNKKNNQGVLAYKAAFTYYSIDDILKSARLNKEDPFIVLLNHIEDPHNFGAIIRTVYQIGVHGIIISDRRSVTLNATVSKVSEGALEYIKICKVKNIINTIEILKDKGLWIVCSDMNGEEMYYKDLTGPICLVIGGECSGVSSNIKKHCDFVVRIPMIGKINSLNASVATGILSYEIYRQRRFK